MTDALKVLTENTSKTIVNGASLVHRYADLLQEIRSNVQGSDERADQKANSIVNDIKDKLSRG